MKKYIKDYGIMCVLVCGYLYSIKNGKIQLENIGECVEMLLLLVPTYLLVNIIDIWIRKETLMKWLGAQSGIKGVVIALFLGTIGIGPLYMAFPMMNVLIKKGSTIKNAFIFLGTWASIKITQMMFEIDSLGIKFTLIRMLFNFVNVYVTAKILEFFIIRNKDWIVEVKDG